MRYRLIVLGALVAACNNGGSDPSTPGPVAPLPDAAAQSGPLTLLPGEVAEIAVAADGAAAVQLATPTGNERFVAIVASTKLLGSSAIYGYTVATDAVSAPTETRIVDGCSITSDAWRNVVADPVLPPSGAAPAIDSTRSLIVSAGRASDTITAKVAAVSPRAIVYVDTTPAHPATVEATFIQEFLNEFDQTILPRERDVFGMESDLDGNGRIGLVFTPLTKDSAVAFFAGCDLQTLSGCGEGNHGEYLYLTPPADIAPPYNTPAAIKEILAHELGHLIHFNRKVVKNKLQTWPDSSYMIEGFGGFAQDVIGYQAGNFYVTKAGLDGIGDFSMTDVLGDVSQYDTARDGVLRGGGYLFVRFLYDRAGGDTAVPPSGTIAGKGGPAFIHALLDSPKSVAEAITTSTKAAAPDVIADFYTAVALSNGDANGAAKPLNPCFAYLPTEIDPITGKQRGANLFTPFHGQAMKGPAMQTLAKADKKIRAGGVEYLTIDATAGQAELGVTIAPDPQLGPRVRIARVR
jgi:hypothetical protein